MVLWKVDFMLICMTLFEVRECEGFDLDAVKNGCDPINGVFNKE
jgi:hypothetical protein